MIKRFDQFKLYGLLLLGGLFMCSAILFAQIEGPTRGVRPIASNGDFEVTGIKVDISGSNSFEARQKGWQIAQRKAWKNLWSRTRGSNSGGLSDSSLDALVSAIIVEEEQIGPNRYIATLGVIFDRARAGQILGVGGIKRRSAPLLILPVSISGGAPALYERRSEWQKAWARYRTSDSRIDYVRPSGAGSESLLLNAGQINRRARSWWRVILDEFGAADIVSASVRYERTYPGGPIIGHFTARYGPDNVFLDRFSLRVSNKDAIPNMMDQAVKRMDEIFQSALTGGQLRLDKTLVLEDISTEELEEEETTEVSETEANETDNNSALPEVEDNNEPTLEPIVPIVADQSFSIQFTTPDAGSVDQGENAIRRITGVKSASTTSLALGGTSVMRVVYAGDANALRSALAASGWQVGGAGNNIIISR